VGDYSCKKIQDNRISKFNSIILGKATMENNFFIFPCAFSKGQRVEAGGIEAGRWDVRLLGSKGPRLGIL